MVEYRDMNLKNYTSSVPADRTILNIEQRIVQFGATHIAKEYGEGGSIIAVQFMIQREGKQHVIKLPANPDAVFIVMRKQFPSRNQEQLKQQAYRTAWKLMQDWIEVQLSLIQTNQADMLQVFLPYVWDGEKTYYEYLKCNQFKQLTDKK